MPAEAKGLNTASAKAFARFYIRLVNYASRTGDTKPLKTYGTDSCQSCDAISRNIERIYTAGGQIRSRGWRLESIAVVPLQPTSRPIIDLGIVQSPEKVVTSSGGPTKRFDGGKQPMTMYLRKQDVATWRVDRLDLVS